MSGRDAWTRPGGEGHRELVRVPEARCSGSPPLTHKLLAPRGTLALVRPSEGKAREIARVAREAGDLALYTVVWWTISCKVRLVRVLLARSPAGTAAEG